MALRGDGGRAGEKSATLNEFIRAGSQKSIWKEESQGSSLVQNLREAVRNTTAGSMDMEGSLNQSMEGEELSEGTPETKTAPQIKPNAPLATKRPGGPNVESPLNKLSEGDVPLQFGDWTQTIEITSLDGLPCCTAKDNKHGDAVPSARGGISIPSDARAEWKFKLERARGLVCIGLQSGKVKSGVPFRKPDHRDLVWYYSSDGTLRNGARTVGKKGATAETSDVITMRLANKTLTFHVNETPLTDGISKIEGSPLFFTLQMHRKEDSIVLLSEQFDAKTTEYLKHFSWGVASILDNEDGSETGPAVKMEKQRTMAIACAKGSDIHGGVIPAVRGAKAVDGTATAFWSIQIENARKAIYIGLESEGWTVGMDWWCDEAVDHAWYYGGDGSLRNGNQVIAKSQVLTRQRRAIAPVSASGLDEESEGEGETDGFMSFMEGREGMMEEDYFEPYIPHIRSGNTVGVQLQHSLLTFTINGEPVEGQIEGVRGRVRLAVQMEEEGDAVVILPDAERPRASSVLRANSAAIHT